MAELTAPFVAKNDEKRIVYGPVLIPDEPDTDGDVVSAEKIEQVAHKFLEEYGNIDLMHSLNNVGKVVESYILPFDWEIDEEVTIPKGSWMMGVRVTDDETWKAVKEGKLGGFSIMAIQRSVIKNAKKEKQEMKRVTLADLGDDWIVNAVSLVDEPAVPLAKWIAIKSKKNITSNIDNDIVAKAIEGSLEHRKELIEKKLRETLSDFQDYIYIFATMPDEVIFETVDAEGNHKNFKIGYKIDENGNVEFTTDVKEVYISETVQEVDNSDGTDETKETDEETDGEQQQKQIDLNSKKKNTDSLFSKLLKTIRGEKKPSKKAEKAISDETFEKLKQAKELLDELFNIAEQEINQIQENDEETNEKGGEEMNKEEIQKMIDEKITPLESKLDDILNIIRSYAKDDEEETKEQTIKRKVDENGSFITLTADEMQLEVKKSKDDEEDYKAKYEEVLKQLEKRPFSNRLVGQDSTVKSKEDNEEKSDRNAFGYKIK